jgi:hypothetical protein
MCSGNGGPAAGAANPNGIPDTHMDLWGVHTPLIRRDDFAGGSPMGDWNLIFIPYCTGDVHTGNNEKDYVDDNGMIEPFTYIHNGHNNIMGIIQWMSDWFPQIDRMYVGGCSAGGAGTQVNYYFFRTLLNVTSGYMLNDSGPIFPNSENSAPLHNTIIDSWNLLPVIDTLGDEDQANAIKEDFGNINAILAQEFPNDRMAITYFLRDYNYSRFSYERFYDGIDKAGILDLWGQDTALLVEQYDQYDNLGYYIPYFRTLNDSHCTTIFGFGGSEIDELDVGIYADMVVNGEGPMPKYIDWDGDKISD